jgi:hypothetical protein
MRSAMPLTPLEKKVLTTLEDELRTSDPALAAAAAATADPWSTGYSNLRPRRWVRDELAAEWRAFSTAVHLFFSLLLVGLVLAVIGGVLEVPWLMMLATLVCLGATGCTVYEARARRRSPDS